MKYMRITLFRRKQTMKDVVHVESIDNNWFVMLDSGFIRRCGYTEDDLDKHGRLLLSTTKYFTLLDDYLKEKKSL